MIRLAIVHADDGQVETGLIAPGCSQSSPGPCQSQHVGSMAEANAYANAHGEELYVVGSAVPGTQQWNALTNQVWAMVANPNLVPAQATGGNVVLYAIGALAIYFLFFRK